MNILSLGLKCLTVVCLRIKDVVFVAGKSRPQNEGFKGLVLLVKQLRHEDFRV